MKAGLALCMAVLFAGAVQAAPLPADAAKAVQDYVRAQQMQDSKDRDDRVAARLDALQSGPTWIANPQGAITIVEFFDYTCPYCKATEPRLMRLVDGDKRVKLVLREFPILTKASMIASRAALASLKQGKYRAFPLALMRRDG